MINIGHVIAIHGYADEEDDFFKLVCDTYVEDFYDKFANVERFLCSPDNAKRFCVLVRMKSQMPELPDEDILGCLLNLRKRKYIQAALKRRS